MEAVRADSTRKGETMVVGEGRPRHPKVWQGSEMEPPGEYNTSHARTRECNGDQGEDDGNDGWEYGRGEDGAHDNFTR